MMRLIFLTRVMTKSQYFFLLFRQYPAEVLGETDINNIVSSPVQPITFTPVMTPVSAIPPSSNMSPTSVMSSPSVMHPSSVMARTSTITPSSVMPLSSDLTTLQNSTSLQTLHAASNIQTTSPLQPTSNLQSTSNLQQSANLQSTSNLQPTSNLQSVSSIPDHQVLHTVHTYQDTNETVIMLQQDRPVYSMDYNHITQSMVDNQQTPIFPSDVIMDTTPKSLTTVNDSVDKEYDALLFKVKSFHVQMMKRFQRSPEVFKPALEKYLQQSDNLRTAESLSYALSTFGRTTPREVLLNKYEHTESKRQVLDVHRFMKKHEQSENNLKQLALEKEQAQTETDNKKRKIKGRKPKPNKDSLKKKLKTDNNGEVDIKKESEIVEYILSDDSSDTKIWLNPEDGTTTSHCEDITKHVLSKTNTNIVVEGNTDNTTETI